MNPLQRQVHETASSDDASDLSDELFATLPALPSIDGFANRLADIQVQLDEARAEAEALRQELRAKADTLRAMAGALESI